MTSTIQAIPVDPTPPASGEALIFDGVAYVPTAVGGGGVGEFDSVFSDTLDIITSATPVNIAGMTITKTLAGGRPVLILFNCVVSGLTTGSPFGIMVAVDGVTVQEAQSEVPAASGTKPTAIHTLAVGLSAGSHTFTARARRDAGSLFINPISSAVDRTRLTVIEL